MRTLTKKEAAEELKNNYEEMIYLIDLVLESWNVDMDSPKKDKLLTAKGRIEMLKKLPIEIKD